MKNTRRRNPPASQFAHPHPSEVALPTPMDQHAPPESGHPRAKCRQTVNVSRYRVVVEVTLDDRPKPLARLRHRFVHPSTQLLLDFQQLGPHPFAHRLALQRIAPVPVLPADMRESQKVERLGFPFSSLFPVSFGKPPELNPARFVWVQFQSKLQQPLPKFHQE